nr:hypothetical protein [Salinibacter altiplanensis]
MNVDAKLPFDMLCDSGSSPPSCILSLIGRIPFQKPLDLLLRLLFEGRRASFSLSVPEAFGAFLVESIDLLVYSRMRNVVQARDLRGGIFPIRKQNHVGTHCHSTDFLALHVPELITLLIGRFTEGSMGHIWRAVVTQNGERSLLCIDSSL